MYQRWWVLAAVACGTFMATLDSSIVNIALPTLTKAFELNLFQVKWVVVVYLLVVTCTLLPLGRISDQYGRKRVFQFGYVVFCSGSVLCGISSSFQWLIFSRVVQALGASMLMANGPAIITATFPGSERGSALGILAMVVSAGLISGPSLGGLLVSQMGWRSIFLVNVPIGIGGALLVQRFVKHDLLPLLEKGSFDWVGAILQSILLVSFIILFDPPQISISGSLPFPLSRWVILAFTLIFTAIFVKVESEVKTPLFDLSLLRNRTFWTANLAGLLTFVSFSSVSVLMPFFLEEALHFPPDKAGLFMTAIPFTIFIVAPISGRLSDRLGSRELSVVGSLIGAIGLFAMAGSFGVGIHERISEPVLIAGLCTIGLATGLFQSPNNNAIMGAVPHHKLGVASALLATVRNLGLVTGTGLSTSIFTFRLETTRDFIGSIHFTIFIAGLVGFGAMVASFGKRRGPNRPAEKH